MKKQSETFRNLTMILILSLTFTVHTPANAKQSVPVVKMETIELPEEMQLRQQSKDVPFINYFEGDLAEAKKDSRFEGQLAKIKSVAESVVGEIHSLLNGKLTLPKKITLVNGTVLNNSIFTLYGPNDIECPYSGFHHLLLNSKDCIKKIIVPHFVADSEFDFKKLEENMESEANAKAKECQQQSDSSTSAIASLIDLMAKSKTKGLIDATDVKYRDQLVREVAHVLFLKNAPVSKNLFKAAAKTSDDPMYVQRSLGGLHQTQNIASRLFSDMLVSVLTNKELNVSEPRIGDDESNDVTSFEIKMEKNTIKGISKTVKEAMSNAQTREEKIKVLQQYLKAIKNVYSDFAKIMNDNELIEQQLNIEVEVKSEEEFLQDQTEINIFNKRLIEAFKK